MRRVILAISKAYLLIIIAIIISFANFSLMLLLNQFGASFWFDDGTVTIICSLFIVLFVYLELYLKNKVLLSR